MRTYLGTEDRLLVIRSIEAIIDKVGFDFTESDC